MARLLAIPTPLCEKLTPRTPRSQAPPETPRATTRVLASHGYKLRDRLDGGNYGVIHTGINTITRDSVIIKELNAACYEKELAFREATMMKLCRHPHIVDLYAEIEIDNRLFLAMQYARGGDLHDYIIGAPEGMMNIGDVKRIFAQLILALDHMHKQHVVHIDIKPDNIFLDENHNVLIGDFGLSDVFKPKTRDMRARGGTLHYSAPESFLGASVEGPELDIWSAGAVLYVMLRGRYPFWGESEDDIMQAIMFLEPFWPEWFSEDAIDLLQKMFIKNPHKRISISKIKRHPFIQHEIRQAKKLISTKKVILKKTTRKSSASS